MMMLSGATITKLHDFFFNNARKEESNLLSSIYISNLYYRSIIRSSYFFFTFVSIQFHRFPGNSWEQRSNYHRSLRLSFEQLSNEIQKREKSSINRDLEVDLKKWVVKNAWITFILIIIDSLFDRTIIIMLWAKKIIEFSPM